jgi:tRNA (cmo5U34)-methyltransferase
MNSKGPQLLAMSLDKVIANSARVAKDAAAKGAETLLPYAVENGKIADAAWPELVQDLKSYSANQANGFRGDGQRLIRPTEDIGVSIPVENPDYTPVALSEAKMNFLNLIQALAPPLTAREVKAGVPGNVKGQIIAEINLRKPETPADIRPQDIQKQTFKSGRTVKETNPLRNELQRAGVDTRELIEVTERINSQDIQSVTPRPDLDISAPVTDIIRGGFLPGKPISEFGKEILDLSTEDWKKATESWDGGLTAEAYRIGLAATDRDYVAKLASLRDQALTIFREKMAEGDLDAAYPFATKSQLFSEAYGAATGTGSARTGFKLRGFDEGSIPFPDYEKGAASESFLPGTEMPDGVDPIETAAIRTEGGKIFTGSWHVDAMMKFVDAVSQGLLDEKLPPGVKTLSELLEGNLPDGFIEDGFVTKSGKFLNRAQALDHAEKIGQLKEGVDSMQHRELGGILESREFEQARAFLPGRDQTGLPFKEFFSSVTKGKFGKSNVSFQSLLDLSGQDSFVSELSKHSGDFDEHISKSIPGYKDTQIRKGAALVEAFPEGAKILDIGASEGSLMKTVSSLSDGKIETVSLDPNPDMAEFFRTKSQVPGAVFEEKAFLKGFEDAGKTVEAYAPEDRFDAINESMVFQFISPEREAQIAEAKRLLKPEGVLMLEEKVKNPGWQANEAKKDSEYKNRYFSTDELKEKDRRIGFQQAKQETKAVGMVDNMVEQSALEGLLSENFKHVVQYWDSGNFKGYAASDSLPTLNKVVAGLGDVKTKFSTVETPREVTTFSAEMDPNYRGLAFGKFLPGDVKPKRNMSKADQDEVDRLLAKYEYTPSVKPSAKLTGWILPNQKFTPLETNFHERDLAQNRAKLNKQFGTKFSEVEDVAQRQDAINAGFVRVRFEPNRGEYNVELNSKFFPKQKSALLNQLVENAESIDNLRVSLLTDKGGVADSISLPLDEMEGPEKTAAIEEAINGLRAKGGSFLPSNLKTARKDFGFEDLVGRQEAKQIPWSHFGKSLDPSLMTQGDETLVTPKLLLASGYKTVDLTDNRSFHDLQTYLRALTDDSGRWPATEEGIKQAYKHARQLEIEAFDASRKKDSFLPGTDLLDLGLPDEATVAQQRVKRRVSQTKETFPEAIPLKYQRNEEGEFIIGEDGKPKPSHVEYSFAETPVAKSAIKGIRNQEQREKVIVMALGDKLATFYNKVKSNPEIKAGEKWYSTARTRLKKLFGDDSKFFSELLGATSARTPVEINFRFALDAYNQFKQGEYDSIISKYREGKTKWDKADIADFVKSTGNKVPTRGQFLDWWITENDLTPTQSNGKKFGANSRSVLRVLDGSWASEVQGPKTPNFAGNLVGSTFEATIDVWAARALHRLSNEGSKDKWRILPEMETGVTDADFNLGQAAFRHAANKLGIKPDALQAVLWFGEKNHWEENGWTRGAGAEKSDFNILLAKTEWTTQGTMKTRTPQLDFSLETSDIKPRKKDK